MFLLRHGQSYFNLHFNLTRVDPGIEDPELTPLGMQQAAAAAEKLANAPLTRIIVSPYTRALQTAQPFLESHHAPVDIMSEVRERTAFVCDVGSTPESLPARGDSATTLVISHWAFILALSGSSVANGEILQFDPAQSPPAGVQPR